MKQQIRIAVIVPAGPRDDVMDTLASAVHYCDSSRVILVVDDTHMLIDSMPRVHELSADIAVIPAPPRSSGSLGGLWVKLAAGYRWILERYQPRILLRLDADALLIGHGLEDKAEQAFKDTPNAGLLGACRVGPDGRRRDPSWAARRLRAETGIRGRLHPRCRSSLKYFLQLAYQNGYRDGESALGGAYIHSYQAALDIYERGWFSQPWLAHSKLGEDHIMSLLTVAAGYELAEFSRPTDPMALKHRGLPMHPSDLISAEKLVTHSVRFWSQLNETQIRKIFAHARTQNATNRRSPAP